VVINGVFAGGGTDVFAVAGGMEKCFGVAD